jgi:hypothetical protein
MQPLNQDDDVIIRAWRDEILLDPNAYIISRIGKVESKPKFGPFEDRLKHPKIQEDMIPLVAHAIAEATTWIVFLPTTDKKIKTLNDLIAYYKNYKKSTWKDKQETKDDKIKKITAIEIFTMMWKDLRNRLKASIRCVRASCCPVSATFAPYEELGGSRSKKRHVKKSKKTRKSRH